MKLKSLDPRINRLGIEENANEFSNSSLDQGDTYEAFIQVKEEKPFEHAGVIHAPNENMAILFAKEQYSRRGGTCIGLWIVKTQDIMVSDYVDNNQNVYDLLTPIDELPYQFVNLEIQLFDIFHLKKRGKQHVRVGNVGAGSHEHALYVAAQQLNDKNSILNVWIIERSTIVSLLDEDIWDTLPEKKYRDAIAYKAGDKLKKFKEENKK